MRKLLGMALVIAMMASCSKNEVVDTSQVEGNPEVISFNAFTGKQTKGADNVNEEALRLSGFNVYATQGAAPESFVIDGVLYKYNTDKWSWINGAEADQIKWATIKNYPVKFYAVYPLDAATIKAPEAPVFDFTVTPAAEGNAMVDLLAASAVRTTAATGSVSFPFDHILSKVDFNVNIDPKVQVYIQSIKIWNAGKTATYAFTAGKDGAWSAPNAVNESSGYMGVVNPAVVNATGPVGVPANALIMMPQTSTKCEFTSSPSVWDPTCLTTGTYIEVVYRMTDLDGVDVVGYTDASKYPSSTSVTGPLYVKVGYPFAANWEQKTHYTYTINFGGETSTGGTLVDGSFVTSDSSNSSLPVITPDSQEEIKPGEPIVNKDKVIDFKVSVNPWTTSAVNDIQ